jgi:hypothetical protein
MCRPLKVDSYIGFHDYAKRDKRIEYIGRNGMMDLGEGHKQSGDINRDREERRRTFGSTTEEGV